jgi:hypothetical protein
MILLPVEGPAILADGSFPQGQLRPGRPELAGWRPPVLLTPITEITSAAAAAQWVVMTQSSRRERLLRFH